MQSPLSPSRYAHAAAQPAAQPSRPRTIPARAGEPAAVTPAAVTEDHVLAALMGVIQAARQKGQSIEEVQAAVLADDALLEMPVRQLLSDIVAEAWHQLN